MLHTACFAWEMQLLVRVTTFSGKESLRPFEIGRR